LTGTKLDKRNCQHLSCQQSGKYEILYESVTKLKENNLTRKTVYSNYSFCSKPGDTTNFSEYPDEDNLSPEVPKKDDPFLDW